MRFARASLLVLVLASSSLSARADVAFPPTPIGGTPVPRTFALDAATIAWDDACRLGGTTADAIGEARVSIARETVTIDALRTTTWTRARIELTSTEDVHGLHVAIAQSVACGSAFDLFGLVVRVDGRAITPEPHERDLHVTDAERGPRGRRESWWEWTMDVPASGAVIETEWATPLAWERTSSEQWSAPIGYATRTGPRWASRAEPAITLHLHAASQTLSPIAATLRREAGSFVLGAPSPDSRRSPGMRAVMVQTPDRSEAPSLDATLSDTRDVPNALVALDEIQSISMSRNLTFDRRGLALLDAIDRALASDDEDTRRVGEVARDAIATEPEPEDYPSETVTRRSIADSLEVDPTAPEAIEAAHRLQAQQRHVAIGVAFVLTLVVTLVALLRYRARTKK